MYLPFNKVLIPGFQLILLVMSACATFNRLDSRFVEARERERERESVADPGFGQGGCQEFFSEILPT